MRFQLIPLFLCSLLLFAGQTISVSQLLDMVRSSLALKYDDGKIAKYVKTVTLTDKLDNKTIESLEAQGAGPKTVKALQDLRDESASLKGANETKQTAPVTGGPSLSMPATFPQPPPPDSVKQKEILEAMRNYANSYISSLPNYLCVQVIDRYVSFRSADDFRKEDKVLVKLSYNNGQENYKVYNVNGQMVDTNLETLNGAVSSGEFGSLMKSVFSPKSQAEIAWARWGRLRGKVLAVYSYFIDSGHSDYTLDYDRGAQRIYTAYKGLIFVDENTGVIYRITFEAVDIPSTFPIKEAQTKLDYDDQKIGDNTFILPLYADIRMQGPNSVYTKNEERFTLYQKFGSESSIKFADIPDSLPPDKTQEQPVTDPVMKGLPPPPPK